MSASAHRRTCQQLGVCQDRPQCSECTYPAGECQDERGDDADAPCTRLHRVTLPAPPAPDLLDPPPREHAPRTLVAFWSCAVGLWIVLLGLGVVYWAAR